VLHPIGEGRFELDEKRPLRPWKVTTTEGALDLEFVPGGAHSDTTNFGVVRARFLHPVGAYRGTLKIAGRTLEIDDMLGVAEDQDVLW
jgi:hypothetical protein